MCYACRWRNDMKKEKKLNIVIILLGFIILLFAVLLILTVRGKISLTKGADDTINYDELAKISKSDYNFVRGDADSNYSVNVLASGKVIINFEHYIANISNAKDLVVFSGPGADSIVYILTADGNIYKYNLADVASKKFGVAKVSGYSNIKRILRYKTRKVNAGGCDYVVLIDEDGKYYKLDSYCV